MELGDTMSFDQYKEYNLPEVQPPKPKGKPKPVPKTKWKGKGKKKGKKTKGGKVGDGGAALALWRDKKTKPAKGKAKSKSKSGGKVIKHALKAKTYKPKEKKLKGGWIVKVFKRGASDRKAGQTYLVYVSPKGKSYPSHKKAKKAGLKGF